MAQVLLIDGHNVIGRAPGPGLAREEESREALLRRVAAAWGSRPGPVLVVFDGNRPGSAKEKGFGGLRVVYAGARSSADDEILRRLRRARRGSATVVTSDRELAARARDLGARVTSAEEFLARLGRRRAAPAPEPARPEPLTGDVEEWLRLFSGGEPEAK